MFEHSHEPEHVAERIAELRQPSYIGDAVLGAIDGSITTVAIIAGAIGASLSAAVILALGAANLIADGLSMAVGNYQRARSDQQFARRVRAEEHRHIREHPAGEREEVRQILINQGFQPPLLEQAVEVITSDRKRWVDLMLSEEWGIGKSQQNPRRVALITFVAFVTAGLIPLLPFIAFAASTSTAIWYTAVMTAVVFAGIGAWRARIFGEGMLTGGIETLLTGGGAAFIAFFVAHFLHRWISA